ncbi:MAG: 50S ribosomal protein L18 [Candidatus Niyogibacteria bacterium]|nr:50S ribosomal protein L18 [Candidatus Niyogibacteria bacterium]
MKATKQAMRIRRHRRVRGKVRGSKGCLRFSVFRSNKHIFLQLIDDDAKKTVLGVGDFEKAGKKKEEKSAKKMTKTDAARVLGKTFAEMAIQKGVKKVVFDRGGFAYHGRIKAVAEGAREGGLAF